MSELSPNRYCSLKGISNSRNTFCSNQLKYAQKLQQGDFFYFFLYLCNHLLNRCFIQQDELTELAEFLVFTVAFQDIFIPLIKLMNILYYNYWPNLSLYTMKYS